MAFKTFETTKRLDQTGSDIFIPLESNVEVQPNETGIDNDGIISVGTKIRPGHKLVNKFILFDWY